MAPNRRKMLPQRSSLVTKLLASVTLVLVVIFTFGNIITVRLASHRIGDQAEKQIQERTAYYEKQMDEAAGKLADKLRPQLVILAKFATRPLVSKMWLSSALEETRDDDYVQAMRRCFNAKIPADIRLCMDTYQQRAIAIALANLNQQFVQSSAEDLLTDEDMQGVMVQDQFGELYLGYLKNPSGVIYQINVPPAENLGAKIMTREVLQDGEVVGKVSFLYSSHFIEKMREKSNQRFRDEKAAIEDHRNREAQYLSMSRAFEGFVFFSVIMAVVYFVCLKTILKPLRMLTEGARRLADGDMRHEIAIRSQDELGILSAAFHHMQASIRQRFEDLKLINTAGESLSSSFVKADCLLEALHLVSQKFSLLGAEAFLLEAKRWQSIARLGGNAAVNDLATDQESDREIGTSHQTNSQPDGKKDLASRFAAGHQAYFLNPSQWQSAAIQVHVLAARNQGEIPILQIIVPLHQQEEVLGALLLWVDYDQQNFTEDDRQFLQAMARLIVISLKNIAFLAQVEEKARLESQLQAAEVIQAKLLPDRSAFPGLEIASSYDPTDKLGGDWFDCRLAEGGELVDICMADVAGHGFPASLLTGVASGALSSIESLLTLKDYDSKSIHERLVKIMETLNQAVFGASGGDTLITMAFFSVHIPSGRMWYCNAAHRFPFLIKAKDHQAVALVGTQSPPLGLARDSVYQVDSSNMEIGDTLLLFTDGLLENRGTDGQPLRTRDFRNILNTPFASTNDLVQNIRKAAIQRWGVGPYEDDVSVFACQYTGAALDTRNRSA